MRLDPPVNAVTLVEWLLSPDVLAADLISADLIFVPERGASDAEIAAAEAQVGQRFSDALRRFLRRWNGINLDVVRIDAVGDVAPGHGIDLIARSQWWQEEEENRRAFGLSHPDVANDAALLDAPGLTIFSRELVVFGSDPAGFAYAEGPEGAIFSLDHDGGDVDRVARDFDAFFADYMFGKDAATFMDDEWVNEVRALRPELGL